jgi:hypothetical protein
MAATLPASLEANASDLTVQGLIDRQPIRERTAEYWLTGFNFNLYCCSRALPA